ncbi:hydrolase Nlp/P60 [Amycolatopsis antarctica]|uniref:Hydrolase Nlp/P60 n=1 Tax=Amycolatopsis antarctica TaxID=1854586 RepID=A0A263D985_9PSEU|nr:C40 family peptidase [Amycolatopsis antarctica]OZM73945.1 hydrolase Nlp/P60 [Amycolatopsis antarctica]
MNENEETGTEGVERTDEAAPPAPPGGRRRRLLVIGVAAAVVVGIFVVALRVAPQSEPATTAAGPSPAAQESAAPPAAPSSAPPADTQTPAAQQPPDEGPQFESWVGEVAGWLDIPQRAMHGYALATVTIGQEKPGCELSWVTLAALGKVTSDHGRVGGSAIGDDGTMIQPLDTVALEDFSGASISVPGAAGPMQLSPAMWETFAANAEGAEPRKQNIDDAALTAARALCDEDRDLAEGGDWLDGVTTFQKAPLFQHRVLATANVYGTVGQDATPPNPAALQAVNFSIDKIGLPYVWGGNGEEKGDLGFDCSGLTTAAYGSTGMTLQRTADWQFRSVPLIPAGEEPKLGDLIFYGVPDTKIHHVGIYIGNQQMIDAPTFGQAVQVHPYRTDGDDYAGAGRPA